jgi:cell division protein FtsB
MPEPEQLYVDYDVVIGKVADRVRQLTIDLALRDAAIEQLKARISELEQTTASLNGHAQLVAE